MFDLLDSTNH